MFQIIKYSSSNFEEWNAFIGEANNGTFLFHRNFIEYHGNRFTDHSLLIYYKNQLIAVFPANEDGNKIYSHQGLSYAGLIIALHIKTIRVIHIFYYLLKYYKQQGFKEIIYKAVPKFYFNHFDQSEDYVLSLLNAFPYRRDINSVIPIQFQHSFEERKNRSIKKLENEDIKIVKNNAIATFWNSILIPVLRERHNSYPTHSIYEMQLLQERFPKNINHYFLYLRDRMIAGTTVYKYGNVAHSQYIAANKEGRETGALNYLFYYLITGELAYYDYLSLGISTDNQGKYLNKGLLEWKEGFSTQTYIHDFYNIKIDNLYLLNDHIKNE